mgnify:CR=1 FL=1
MANTRIYSLNVRGIRDTVKRRHLFQKFHNSNYDIFLIQEAHCTPEIESQWSSEWGGEIFFLMVHQIRKGFAFCLKIVSQESYINMRKLKVELFF